MATLAFDFKLNNNGGLHIDEDAMDFVIAPSDGRHVRDLLMSVPGQYKEFPLVGWNPYKYLNAKTSQVEVNKTIVIQLAADGYVVGPGGVNVELTPNGELIPKVIDVSRP